MTDRIAQIEARLKDPDGYCFDSLDGSPDPAIDDIIFLLSQHANDRVTIEAAREVQRRYIRICDYCYTTGLKEITHSQFLGILQPLTTSKALDEFRALDAKVPR